ncbi:MAG: RagB/SusD family nutrient uptake outer membrane protein, partial [Longimicrobiales bacterium]
YDRRSVNPARQQYATNECGQYGAIYQPLSTATWQSINVLEKLAQFGDAEIPDRPLLEQTTQVYGAYARLLLGEGFCTAAIDLGPELSSPEVFELAEALFTDAIAGPDDDLRNMARVGRARARLNLGHHEGALEDARAVPAGYVRNALYSSASTRSQNEVYNRNNQVYGMSVEQRNPIFAGVADPRVASVNTGDLGPNGFDTVWVQLKYESLDAPIPIARYEEAQLIIAEIEGGQTAVDIINRLHDAAGIPHFTGGSEAEIQQHVIQERARELYLEGQRFWDIRRFEIPFDPPVGAQYPTGSFYGDTRCFPLPDLERDNNPNLQGG